MQKCRKTEEEREREERELQLPNMFACTRTLEQGEGYGGALVDGPELDKQHIAYGILLATAGAGDQK